MIDRQQIVREYFSRVDAGREDILELFTEDFEFYFPKFGVWRGKEAFGVLIAGLLTSLDRIVHPVDQLRMFGADSVAVEGLTLGTTKDGTAWHGGVTPGGRFCSIFEFSGELISRMFVYTDPDYGSHDAARFLWGRDSVRQW
jgi:hypothetical protein